MRVLVTGGAGYLGSVLSSALLAHGHEVRVLDTLMYGGQPVLSLCGLDSFEFVRGDVRSWEAVCSATRSVDAVVHLAAIVGDPACARDPEKARDINEAASLRTFEAAARSGVGRFVFASTCSNYGKMADRTAYVAEDSELRPLSVYAETKVAVERHLLDSANQNGTAATVLRFATLHGLSPRMRFDLTVNQFTMELLTRERLILYGAEFWRPYVHVRDAAHAVELALSAPREHVDGAVYNVGSTNENYQKGTLVNLICEQLGHDVQVERVNKDEDPRDYKVSFEKISNVLGFRPARTVRDGIREVVGAISSGVITDFDSPANRN